MWSIYYLQFRQIIELLDPQGGCRGANSPGSTAETRKYKSFFKKSWKHAKKNFISTYRFCSVNLKVWTPYTPFSSLLPLSSLFYSFYPLTLILYLHAPHFLSPPYLFPFIPFSPFLLLTPTYIPPAIPP